MFKDLFKNYIYPIAVFSGAMIGVGFLSLPYIALQSGIWITLFYFVILTALVVMINLIFCQISLDAPDFKRFPGFVGYYLGKRAEFFTMVLTILGSFGVLLIYILIGSQFLASVFQPLFSGSELVYVLIYFFIVSIIIYFDIKVVARVELWVLVLLFLSLFFIFVESFSLIKLDNIFIDNRITPNNFFLPYGPLLFALWGTGLIPEIEEMLAKKKKHLKKIVTISTILISAFYFLFVLLILGITGHGTQEAALTGLKNLLPNFLISIALLIGVLVSLTAFITQGILLKKTLMFDLRIKHWQAFVMTCFTPLILFLLGLKFIIPLISLTGGFLLGVDCILILLIYKKIGGKNIIIYPLSLVFLLGAIYEVINFIR